MLVSVVEDYVRLLHSLRRPSNEIQMAERRLETLRNMQEQMAN